MRNQHVERWEAKLKVVFDQIDDTLEERYHGSYPLHPTRLSRGQAANKEDDGLFELGVSFSAGIGSKAGPGYVFRVRLATLATVPDHFREQLTEEVIELLQQLLPQEFPGTDLRVGCENGICRVYGDLSLD